MLAGPQLTLSCCLTRTEGSRYHVRKGAGWHLSYYMGLPDLARKLESFSHSEYDSAEFKAADHIRCHGACTVQQFMWQANITPGVRISLVMALTRWMRQCDQILSVIYSAISGWNR